MLRIANKAAALDGGSPVLLTHLAHWPAAPQQGRLGDPIPHENATHTSTCSRIALFVFPRLPGSLELTTTHARCLPF